jgi:antitoxin HicB
MAQTKVPKKPKRREKEKPRPQYKLPLLIEPQSEGGFTVTSPVLPELVTEGDTLEEALANPRDAFAAVVEGYEELDRSLPSILEIPDNNGPLWLETVAAAP